MNIPLKTEFTVVQSITASKLEDLLNAAVKDGLSVISILQGKFGEYHVVFMKRTPIVSQKGPSINEEAKQAGQKGDFEQESLPQADGC
jgi:hypothetical protein